MSYLLIAASTLLSEDLTCLGAGLMVARGEIGFLPATASCLAGILAGDLLLYLAGRLLGRPALSRAPLCWIAGPERIEAASDWVRKRGAGIVLAARFLPGLRLPTYVAAGILRTSLPAFALWFLLAAAVWTPLLVGGAAWLGAGFLGAAEAIRWGGGAPAVLALLLLFAALKLATMAATYRGRRLLLSSYLRITRWEFWPPWLFYLPVVPWVLRLGWKHRAPTLFTAANPAMPAGGFVGESKSCILADLEEAGAPVARHLLLAAPGSPSRQHAGSPPDVTGEDQLARALRFMALHGLGYPIVLKPDVGQRGAGVRIVHGEEELVSALRESRVDLILQEHVAGDEFGVFYVRHPAEPRGRIFSMTEKRLPSVVGDGRRTLERLILEDPRAVCMARYFLKQHRDRLEQVPAAGGRVALTDLGNHCRGAVFLDGAWAKTPALEEAIDRIASGYRGFHFGRFDLRAESIQALREGRGFKILELNGVASEATEIYDPRGSLVAAYRKLFEQWRLAFEIGLECRRRGCRPAGMGELLIMIGRHLLPGADPGSRLSLPTQLPPETLSAGVPDLTT